MTRDSLTPLQRRILHVLAPLKPPFTLTGGGALALHLAHRGTRDLDLFWREHDELRDTVGHAQSLLESGGLTASVLRTSPQFVELRVSDGHDVCVVDLVAEPYPSLDAPQHVNVSGVSIPVDSMHEILAAKLTALLGRMEIRDLRDVEALIESGGDLAAAVRDAPKKDSGFSPLTLAWVLESFDPRPLVEATGGTVEDASRLDAFRRQLIDELIRISRPE